MKKINGSTGIDRFSWLALAAVAIPVAVCVGLLSQKNRLGPRDVFIGLPHGDDVVYYACAREYFENGNGLFAATPYSSSPDSPRIYSHLVFLTVGWIQLLTGAEVTFLDYSLRIIFGATMLLLALRIARLAVPRDGPVTAACLAAMFCGGAAWVFSLARMFIDYVVTTRGTGSAPDMRNWLLTWPDFFRQTESGYGSWGLNLFRPAGMTMEAAYHILFFACIHSMLAARPRLALLFLFLTWWAHPFTGIELGFVVTTYLLIDLLFFRRHHPAVFCTALGVDLLFFAYYGLILPSFPEHLSVHERMMAQGTPMPFNKLAPAYGLFLLGALAYARTTGFKRRFLADPATRLITIWALCAAFLIFHDRLIPFMHPIQPMHFTRGYLFFPLLLLFFGYLRRLYLIRWRARPHLRSLALAALFLVHAPDNLIYSYMEIREKTVGHSVFHIRKDCRELLRRLDNIPETETFVTMEMPPGYTDLAALVPVLTRHRVLIGHRFNTPWHDHKSEQTRELLAAPTAGGFRRAEITAVVCGGDYLERLRAALAPDDFVVLFTRRNVHVVRLDPGTRRDEGESK